MNNSIAINEDELNWTADTKVASLYIAKQIMELKEVQSKKSKLDKQEKELKKEIQDYMGESRYLENERGITLCTWIGYESTRFNTKDFKEAWESLYDKYLKTSTQKRFIIK